MKTLADICKRRRYDGPTPCWWPECDCEHERRSRLERIWDGFILGLASPAMLITRLIERFR